MNRFGILFLLSIGTFCVVPDSVAQWYNYPSATNMQFPDGYLVTKEPKANSGVVKTVPGPTEAVVKGYFTNPEGVRFYLSDWSWDRRMSGQSHFWMLPKATRSTPAPGSGTGKGYQVMSKAEEISFPSGFTILSAPSADAKTISTKPGPLTAAVRAYKDSGGIRYYMTDWSYQRIREGHQPNWIKHSGPQAPAMFLSAGDRKKSVSPPIANPAPPSDLEFSDANQYKRVFERGYELLSEPSPTAPVKKALRSPQLVPVSAVATRGKETYYLSSDQYALRNQGKPFLWLREIELVDHPQLLSRFTKLAAGKDLTFNLKNYTSIPWKFSMDLFDLDREKGLIAMKEVGVEPFLTAMAGINDDLEFPFDWVREAARHLNQKGTLERSIKTMRDHFPQHQILHTYYQQADDEMMVSYMRDRVQFDRRLIAILEAEQQNFAEVEKLLSPIIDGWTPTDDGLDASGPRINVLREIARAQWKQGKTEAARKNTRLWLDTYARDIASELLHPEYIDASQRVMEFDSDFEVIGDYFDLLEAVTDPEVAAEIVVGLKGLKLAVTTSQQIQRANSADPAVATLSRELVQLLEQKQRDDLAGKEPNHQREERLAEIHSDLAMRRLNGTQLALRDDTQWSKLQGEIERRRQAGEDKWDVKKLSEQRDLIALGHMIERGNFIAKTADVAASLRNDEALIDFFELPGATLQENGRYGAVILLADGSTHLTTIGDTQTIDDSVKEFRDLVQITGKFSNHTDEQLETESVKVRARVFDLILKPLLPHLVSVRKLAICADSQLLFVPFDALHSGDENNAANQWEITYLNAARDLLRPRNEQAAAGGTALLVGNPEFQKNSGSNANNDRAGTLFSLDDSSRSLLADASRGVSFGPLPGTKEEVLKLAPQLASAGYQVKTLTGDGATESALTEFDESPTILHLATHGFFFNQLPVANLSDEAASGKSAMLLSGLALTGAQNTLEAWDKGTFPNPSSDGMLLASEVSQLDLSRTNTVVLSACETAVGKALSGEGVEGLRSGLTLAGAENVVLTLWPVDDAATVEVMEVFYEKMLSGLPAPIAMAETKRELFKKFADAEGKFPALQKIDPFIVTRSGGL